MSSGAMNCPFLMLTARPVRAAATTRSVCRQRKAGIWSTSQTSAAGAHWCGSWTSVITGRPVSCLTSRRTRSPSSRPGPRKLLSELRFALSKEDLKTSGDAQALGHRGQRVGHLDHQLLALDHAGAGDDGERATAHRPSRPEPAPRARTAHQPWTWISEGTSGG